MRGDKDDKKDRSKDTQVFELQRPVVSRLFVRDEALVVQHQH